MTFVNLCPHKCEKMSKKQKKRDQKGEKKGGDIPYSDFFLTFSSLLRKVQKKQCKRHKKKILSFPDALVQGKFYQTSKVAFQPVMLAA
jgi:hypothetical protein